MLNPQYNGDSNPNPNPIFDRPDAPIPGRHLRPRFQRRTGHQQLRNETDCGVRKVRQGTQHGRRRDLR